MTIRRTPLVLLIALVLAVGLSLGSIGAATARGITAHTVKKIAGKVVAKKASSLSVAHAATAGDASTVGGATAGQLGVRPIVFTLTSGTFTSGTTFPVSGIPTGRYLITFNGVLGATAGTLGECFVEDNDAPAGTGLILDGYATGASHLPSINAVGVATVTAGHHLEFVCNSSGSWSVIYPIHLSFTPLASVTDQTLVAGPKSDSLAAPTR